MTILLIILAALYIGGLLFAVVAAGMKMTDDSALTRHEAWAQLRRAPIWPVDEYKRQRASYIESKHLANIEQAQQILDRLDQVERAQQRNRETWEKAINSQQKLREIAGKDVDSHDVEH